MKRLILLIACCVGLSAFAANTSFNSFNTNQFDITGNRVALLDGLQVTNIVLFGSSSNLLEVWNSDNVLKFYIDTNGNTFPSIWTTNGAGTIQASSTVEDGVDAAFRLNSSNYLADPSAVLMEVKNHNTNTFTVGADGTIYLGDIEDVNVSSMQATATAQLLLRPKDTANNYARVRVGASQSDVALVNLFNSVAWNLGFYQYRTGTNVFPVFYSYNGVRNIFLFDPGLDFGGTCRYTLDTTVTASSGNLLEVKNNGTNKFVVPFDGAVETESVVVNQSISIKGNASINTLIVTNTITIGGNLAATYAGITNVMTWALSDMTTALTTGTNKNYWYAPAAGMTIKFVRATLATASSSGTPTFDINEAGTSILSTKITIDANEWDSFTAATPPVISDSAIAANAKVDFDIDVAGTAAAGAQIQIGFTVP